ncbi:hypothetical protein SLEP1_g44575 [Rubroshorea leprosula]|uniref:At1g68980-like TPR repeats domain-containing protein n=1 Tax=Rubroshorea leprosula TaxID=152421 RepID=A0AAV5LGK6_9ROSI|nr:hypothetical protein SLEP1_g44575 [Rubroshorea leprosula]
MVFKLTSRILINPLVISRFSFQFLVGSYTRSFVCRSFAGFQEPDRLCKPVSFCSSTLSARLCWENSSHAILLQKLESTLREHKVGEAWESFNDFRRLYGLPHTSLVARLVTELSYASSPNWLQKAGDLVIAILNLKCDFLPPVILNKAVLSLARAQMPIPSSMILRLMLIKGILPPMNVLCLVVLHMVKTEVGTCIASNVLVQICDSFLHLSTEKGKHAKAIKPDTMIFNLVLDACVKFGSSLKGQQIVELMAKTGVVADADSIIIIAKIHEMNGLRDEIKRFKDHIDLVQIPFVSRYCPFYDSLLSLHFKFGDIDAAAELVLEMTRRQESCSNFKPMKNLQKPCIVPIGSEKLRNGLKIQILPELLKKDSALQVETKSALVIFKDGKLLPSNKALAKLILGYKKQGRISELSELLVCLKAELCSGKGSNLCDDVLDACIELGWLETAHDILDDMESAGNPMGSSTYVALLTAYYKQNMSSTGNALLRKIRKHGWITNLSNESVISACLSKVSDKSPHCTNVFSFISQSSLHESLVREIQEEEMTISPSVFQLNSSIYFFCRAKMIEDALKIYRRMQEMKIRPTVHIFSHLIDCYSSLHMHRDITILWGDIKRNMDSWDLVCRDLYEFLLMSFLRGGYFGRVMEIIGYMERHGMYIDKWMYKSEFLKLYKNLYRSLKASEAQTEAQAKRLEHVHAFKKWACID